MLQLHFKGEIEGLEKGIDYFKDEFGFEISSDGVVIQLQHDPSSAALATGFDGSEGTIRYTTRNSFFRQLSRWLAFYEKETSFYKEETISFNKVGTMIDVSRNAVLHLDGAKELLRHMAKMGFNQAMLYSEDTYEVAGFPYFGYLRGRYSKEELNALDDYADDLGIEMIPCIQILGHLYQVLQYGTHADIQDTSDVLLVGEPETYAFIEKLITNATAPFRSKRIHIGMDEAFGVGTGRYRQKNGNRDTFDIMNEHVQKVVGITEKLGLEAMMWSDMYYRAGSKTGDYYDQDAEVPEEIIKEIPEVDMVFWDYYHDEPEAYKHFLMKHIEMKQKVIFAGGVWTWNGIAPNYGKSLETTKAALPICKELDIREVFATMWGDDGAETPAIAALPGLQYFADLCYRETVDFEELAVVFENNFGMPFDIFYLLNRLDETPGVELNNLETSAGSKVLLWQDPLLGRFDKVIEGHDLNTYYKDLAEQLRQITNEKKSFRELFALYTRLAFVLSKKAEFGVRMKAAYDKKDRKALSRLAGIAAELTEDLEELRLAHQKAWTTYNKPFGWEVLDIRYGGAVARMKTVSSRLEAYLNGELSVIEELEEDKLLDPSSTTNGLGRGFYRDLASTSKLSGV
ncbi:Glycosyl hydrolase family 20, catalytic domain [Alkalibacterium subtropicum]|uniref:Glycosyl hydrolase family 20, catalytic domain n=1 Tax=Alkalibacterium subtropicum TaxID=753702 RepID=A0A1I1GC44_9LACT|nr:beta-N-acetylhexosaminidase [Alkalibacterium subtropicum]SFC09085.1 Glycosyl hydrolase family 20, catalytic domain [Alkalibacterium subtropicum]